MNTAAAEQNHIIEKRWILFQKDIFELFVMPGEVVEVRIPKVFGKSQAWGREFARGTVSGYFDDHEAFCKAVELVDKEAHSGVYFSLQVIDPRLLARAYNCLKPSTLTTSDHNVIAYRWLPIDIDPVRPAGIGSSDTELRAALRLRDQVAGVLVTEYDLQEPVRANSGNGGHLLVRLPDMPVEERTKLFVASILSGLSKRFSNDHIEVDTTVFNPARIWKLYGTTARKGDAVPAGPHREARPHRLSFIEEIAKCLL